jgi:hypothetical protein
MSTYIAYIKSLIRRHVECSSMHNAHATHSHLHSHMIHIIQSQVKIGQVAKRLVSLTLAHDAQNQTMIGAVAERLVDWHSHQGWILSRDCRYMYTFRA